MLEGLEGALPHKGDYGPTYEANGVSASKVLPKAIWNRPKMVLCSQAHFREKARCSYILCCCRPNCFAECSFDLICKITQSAIAYNQTNVAGAPRSSNGICKNHPHTRSTRLVRFDGDQECASLWHSTWSRLNALRFPLVSG